jgi:hypothetical protein
MYWLGSVQFAWLSALGRLAAAPFWKRMIPSSAVQKFFAPVFDQVSGVAVAV